MNLDELKPLWENYKAQVNEQSEWTQNELSRLIKSRPAPVPWYQKAQRPFLHFCVSCLLITITSGC
ncbi:MAG: hypothetical protein U0X91_30095 [Spirosomataceae bacterium]